MAVGDGRCGALTSSCPFVGDGVVDAAALLGPREGCDGFVWFVGDGVVAPPLSALGESGLGRLRCARSTLITSSLACSNTSAAG